MKVQGDKESRAARYPSNATSALLLYEETGLNERRWKAGAPFNRARSIAASHTVPA